MNQAVDFPKQGIPVDLDADDQKLPRTLIRCKPDWHAAEVVSPRKTDYYISTRALGHMFRSITIDDPDDITQELRERTAAVKSQKVLSDPISAALLEPVGEHISVIVADSVLEGLVKRAFQKYGEELRYICMTHTVTNTPGVQLLEAEVVLGTILAKCQQKRWRKERMWRMRTHAGNLVRNVQQELDPEDSHSVEGLERAWCAWSFSLRHQDQFGANSFGLIALGIILDCLEWIQ
jgi:RNA-dependent RNA polymerase